MKKLLAFLCAVAAVATPLFAVADPYGDLQKIAAAFNAKKGFHADEHFSNGQSASVDMIPPDRIKVMPSAGGGEIVIGNDMWSYANGKWTKLPSFVARFVVKKIDQYRHLGPSQVDAGTAKDLGMQFLAGRRLHAYSYVSHGTPATIWVDAHYLPVQEVVKSGNLTTTITYRYNGVTVDAP